MDGQFRNISKLDIKKIVFTRIHSPFSVFPGHKPTPRGDAGYPWDGRVREVHAGDFLDNKFEQ